MQNFKLNTFCVIDLFSDLIPASGGHSTVGYLGVGLDITVDSKVGKVRPISSILITKMFF